MKNKRGWIKIVEAFVAILLIMGVVLIFINKGYFGKSDISEKVYEYENSVLREIELNQSLRGEILNIPEEKIPMESDNLADYPYFPASIQNKVHERTPEYLSCKSKICKAERICSLNSYLDKDIYARAIIITANSKVYNPKQLKIFCWAK
jgi:hypothetical protein